MLRRRVWSASSREIGDQTFDRVHREGTLRVIEAAQHCGVGRIVHMSALGTRANAASSMPRQDQVGRRRGGAEIGVGVDGVQAFRDLRPRRRVRGTLFARMSRWSPVLPAIGAGRLQPVPVECVALAFAQGLEDRRPRSGALYDLLRP
jgi:NADH dehydrogenase